MLKKQNIINEKDLCKRKLLARELHARVHMSREFLELPITIARDNYETGNTLESIILEDSLDAL